METQLLSYGLLALFAKLSARRHFSLGRTKVQKLVFLLNELMGIDSGYKFHFYTYGPFSSELAGDIDYLDRINVLKVEEISGGEGYLVTAGSQAEKVEKMVQDRLAALSGDVEKIVDEFGACSARDLEMIATLIFVIKYDPKFSGDIGELIVKAKELKPKFSENEIKMKVNFLSEKKFLSDLAVA